MIRNNDKQHVLTTICSLNKSILNAKLKGKLISSEIYVLTSIYNLLTKCTDSLTEIDKNKLSLLYNHIFYNYSNICKRYDINSSLNKSTPVFRQNNVSTSSTVPSFKYINYWQEIDYSTTFEDVKTLVLDPSYPESKFHDSYGNFENGITITYSNIGRICFVLKDTLYTENYAIYDILDNNISDSFSRHYDTTNNYILFVSNNIYSYGDMFIKIKKINNDFSIFNDIFNNIFS